MASVEITEKEAVTRASQGRLTICALCYDVRGKIVMVKHDTTKPAGIIRDFCDECAKAISACGTCHRN
jgi:hypothetical protein